VGLGLLEERPPPPFGHLPRKPGGGGLDLECAKLDGGEDEPGCREDGGEPVNRVEGDFGEGCCRTAPLVGAFVAGGFVGDDAGNEQEPCEGD